MARSEATTVEAYFAELPAERASAISSVREIINQSLQPGFVEAMDWGMIAWEVPLETYPNTYNKRPLMLAAVASQKNYISLYLTNVYAIPELLELLKSSGKRLRMGKGCINFSSADELPLGVLAEIIRRTTLDKYLEVMNEAMAKRKVRR